MIESATRNKFSTDIFSIQKLGDSRYLIPTYQRPYVWKEEQISKLLDDFREAYLRDDEHYFIGTILTSIQNGKEELIDGQQRFTTLWLIAVAFKTLLIESEITGFLNSKEKLRFDFAIREKLGEYLQLLMQDKKLAFQKFPVKEIENDDYLIQIAKGITTIEGRIKAYKFKDGYSANGFGDYIFKNIQFVKNTTPHGTDLNKLFATINNSGIQLEQTDILKANLLKHIKSDKILYSRIWEACENMENYFEKNVKKVFPESDWSAISVDDFKQFDSGKFRFKKGDAQLEGPGFDGSNNANEGSFLSEILKDSDTDTIKFPKLTSRVEYYESDEIEEVVYCQSIVSFGQLLLHSYRVFLHQNDKGDFIMPFHIKNLLAIFKGLENQADAECQIKDFLECLWKVRYAFDKHVVKWVEKAGEKDKFLTLSNIYKDNSKNQYPRSPKEKNELSMLQSVLYFTSNYNTQIWLSPFLKRIIDGESPLECLENIDNNLSVSLKEDKETSYNLMDKFEVLSEKLGFENYLESAIGTSFKHYWFQKLEYILWKNWTNRNDPKFREYRITSKNSVEHVFPQHHEFGVEINQKSLHSFGNLGLLNVSQNSTYSAQAVGKKRIDFFSPAKISYDSLKLYFVYNDHNVENWSESEIENHQNDMINRIITHYCANILS